MGLFKRGNVWWAYFYIEGVRHQISTGTGSKRRAEAIFKKRREEAQAQCLGGLPEVDRKLTFAGPVAEFIAARQATPYHIGRLEFPLPYFGDYPVVRIKRGLANRYRRRRHSKKRLTEATVNRDLSVLRRILNWGVEEGRLAFNPLGRLRLARERRVKRPVLNLSAERKLLAAAPEHLRKIAAAALDTGMRRGEILNLLWEDVDRERNLLYVSRSKTPPEGEAREIPLTRRLSEILKLDPQPEGTIFTFRGKPIHSLKTTWKTTLRNSPPSVHFTTSRPSSTSYSRRLCPPVTPTASEERSPLGNDPKAVPANESGGAGWTTPAQWLEKGTFRRSVTPE